MSGYGTYDPVVMFTGANRRSDMNDTNPTVALLPVSQAAGDVTDFVWVVHWPMRIKYIGYNVADAAVDTPTTDLVFAIDKRVTAESDTGRVEVARINVADNEAVGASGYIDAPILNADLDPGDELVLEVITAGTGGGATGSIFPYIACYLRAETPANTTGWRLATTTQVV